MRSASSALDQTSAVKHDQRALQKHREQQGEVLSALGEPTPRPAFGTVGQTEVRQCARDALHAELGQSSATVSRKNGCQGAEHIHHLLARFNLLQRFG